jgi:hypothetical protein
MIGKRSLLLLAILLPSLLAASGNRVAFAAGPTLTFAAAGDHSQDTNTNSSLRRLASARVNFYLAIGDMSYGDLGEETTWCNIVKSFVGPNFPFELVSGFHEDGREASSNNGGLIDNFANCLPDRMGAEGTYGKEYYFDYPSSNPLARIIMVSPALNFSNGGYYSYSVGFPHYQWLSAAIDRARTSGIPWVIVAMHKPCISAGTYLACTSGQDVMNLLIEKKVDLVLQAHDHNYQRSKQLTCALVEQFSSGCVANDGSAGTYTKGQGTVFVISGTFGQEFYPINFTNPNALYFATLAGKNTSGLGHGFLKVTVTTNEIEAMTQFSGNFSDSFHIVKPDPLLAAYLFIEHNLIFGSLLIAPILLGITLFVFKRRRGWSLFAED